MLIFFKKINSILDQLKPKQAARIHFRSKPAFYIGCIAIIVGALLHLPMFIMAKDTGYRLAGMPMDTGMLIGMFLIIAGTLLAMWGLTPNYSNQSKYTHNVSSISIRAIDNAPFTKLHLQLIIVLSLALIIDIMKPASLAFVLPGTKIEYGLTQWEVAFFPFSALIGTAIGSFIWGILGDYLGRRASILLAALMFMGTSICGAMPTFNWNLFMCFMMGLSAGGLLPVAMSLLAEMLPSKSRAAFLVILGGIGAVGGYLAASGFAALLEPTFGWRIMWFLNLPTGLALIFMNRYIPESPRFLLSQGRLEEAKQIMEDFKCVTISTTDHPKMTPLSPHKEKNIFKLPYLPHTIALMLYGLAWGLVNYGFMLWLPTNLREVGFGVGTSDALLAKSALVAFPSVFFIAWLYVRWSSRQSLILFSLITALTLLAFIPLALNGIHQQSTLLTVLVIILLMSSTGMTVTLLPYAGEIYPTIVRATGSGLVAGCGKLGGVLGVAVVIAHVTPTLIVSASMVAIPVIFAMLILIFMGIETRGKTLEEVNAIVDIENVEQ